MTWKFENAAPVIGSITEGNCWDGEIMLYSNIAMNRIMKFNPKNNLVSVFCENTEGINHMIYPNPTKGLCNIDLNLQNQDIVLLE